LSFESHEGILGVDEQIYSFLASTLHESEHENFKPWSLTHGEYV